MNYLKYLIAFFLQKKLDRVSRKKLQKIKNNVTFNENRKVISEYKKLWKSLGKRPSKLFIKCIMPISGIESHQYVPENFQYGIIEPKLNNKSYALTFNDKNFFEKYLYNFKDYFPDTLLRGINGVTYDKNYYLIQNDNLESYLSNLNLSDFILKPATETGGGENVLLVKKNNSHFIINKNHFSSKRFVHFLKNNYKNNFVLQHRIVQLKWFEDFNTSSLNTVRLYVYRSVSDESIQPIHAYIRFGKPGSIVDSSSQGGRTCGITTETGILNDFAIGKFGEKYRNLVWQNAKSGTIVPHFNEMKEITKKIAPYYYYHRLLGFDFCVNSDNKIKLLEINTLNIGVINQQMNNGPLYKEHIKEVIEHCSSKQKSVVLDFYV